MPQLLSTLRLFGRYDFMKSALARLFERERLSQQPAGARLKELSKVHPLLLQEALPRQLAIANQLHDGDQ